MTPEQEDKLMKALRESGASLDEVKELMSRKETAIRDLNSLPLFGEVAKGILDLRIGSSSPWRPSPDQAFQLMQFLADYADAAVIQNPCRVPMVQSPKDHLASIRSREPDPVSEPYPDRDQG